MVAVKRHSSSRRRCRYYGRITVDRQQTLSKAISFGPWRWIIEEVVSFALLRKIPFEFTVCHSIVRDRAIRRSLSFFLGYHVHICHRVRLVGHFRRVMSFISPSNNHNFRSIRVCPVVFLFAWFAVTVVTVRFGYKQKIKLKYSVQVIVLTVFNHYLL